VPLGHILEKPLMDLDTTWLKDGQKLFKYPSRMGKRYSMKLCVGPILVTIFMLYAFVTFSFNHRLTELFRRGGKNKLHTY